MPAVSCKDKWLRPRLARGKQNDRPSEHPFDGFSYLLENGLVEIADLSDETFRIYDAHLGKQRVSVILPTSSGLRVPGAPSPRPS